MADASGREPLRRGSARALHEQLSDALQADFLASYKAGDQIPTEAALGHIHGLSRVTVRRAIQTLVGRGMLVRRQGKGTFLASPKPRIVHAIDRFGPFTDAFAASAETVTVTLLGFEWLKDDQTPEPFRSAAGKSAAGKALAYERLYVTADVPHALVRILLPADLGERVSRADASRMGVYQILEERLGIRPARAEFQISSELPDARLAGALRVSPSTPVLTLDRTTYDRDGRAVERTTHHLLPEIYKLSVSVARQGDDR